MEKAITTKGVKTKKLEHYDLIAKLFHYPDTHYVSNVKIAYEFLEQNYPTAATELKDFLIFTENSTLTELQELYLRSFDVQAITTLDIGYVLFGDDYKRGQLLVNLNREHRDAGNEITSELSDHLPNVVRLISKLKDEEILTELVQKIIALGVKKMIGEFDPQKIVKKDEVYKKHLKSIIDVSVKYRMIFELTLKTLLEVMKIDFDLPEDTSINSDFMNKVGEEMRIEA